MINENEKVSVINKAREWAKAERRLRVSGLCFGVEKEWAARESDRTEEELLNAVRKLEEAEHPPVKILTFFGRTIRVGDRIDDLLFTWLEGEARRVEDMLSEKSRRWW